MTWVIWIFVAIVGLFVFLQAEQTDCSTSPGGTEACPARRVVAPTPAAVRSEGWEWEEITVGEITGVIVPEAAASSLLASTFPELRNGDFWTPTLMDVEAVESAIAAEQGQLDHMRQYAGFIENGERKVLVNGFCDAMGIDWTTERVLVDDGGDCFFTAIYNVDRAALETFHFNAEG
jgi:hypothetical protein